MPGAARAPSVAGDDVRVADSADLAARPSSTPHRPGHPAPPEPLLRDEPGLTHSALRLGRSQRPLTGVTCGIASALGMAHPVPGLGPEAKALLWYLASNEIREQLLLGCDRLVSLPDPPRRRPGQCAKLTATGPGPPFHLSQGRTTIHLPQPPQRKPQLCGVQNLSRRTCARQVLFASVLRCLPPQRLDLLAVQVTDKRDGMCHLKRRQGMTGLSTLDRPYGRSGLVGNLLASQCTGGSPRPQRCGQLALPAFRVRNGRHRAPRTRHRGYPTAGTEVRPPRSTVHIKAYCSMTCPSSGNTYGCCAPRRAPGSQNSGSNQRRQLNGWLRRAAVNRMVPVIGPLECRSRVLNSHLSHPPETGPTGKFLRAHRPTR